MGEIKRINVSSAKTVINLRQATLTVTVSAMLLMIMLLTGCEWTTARLAADEKDLVMSSDGLMRVQLATSREDSLLLRKHCTDLAAEDILSEAYNRLVCRMVATVTDSTQDGVGLAAPQIGLFRRVVAVMRYDKP